MRLIELVQDERHQLSTARVLLWIWSAFSLGLIALHWATVPNAVLAFLSGIEVALITWAAGARIAQYIGPQISGVASAVGQSVREKILKRRDTEAGVDPTP